MNTNAILTKEKFTKSLEKCFEVLEFQRKAILETKRDHEGSWVWIVFYMVMSTYTLSLF